MNPPLRYLRLILLLVLPTLTRAAFAQPVVKVGSVLSLSNWAAMGGEAERNGLLLALEDINARGGVRGRPVELVLEDNQSDLKKTATATNKLVSVDKVPVILGPNFAEFSAIAAPIAESKRTVMLSATGYSTTLTKGRPFVFTAMASHQEVVRPLADFIKGRQHGNLTILASESEYFLSLANSLKTLLHTPTLVTFPTGEFDYRATIAKLKRADVQAVGVFLMQAGEQAAFYKQCQELGYRPVIYTNNALMWDEQMSKQLQLAEGATFFEMINFAGEQFTRRYREKFHIAPVYSAPKAYDNFLMIAEVMDKCGIDAEAIRNCLQTVKYSGLTGEISFDEERNRVVKSFQSSLYRVENATVVPVVEGAKF